MGEESLAVPVKAIAFQLCEDGLDQMVTEEFSVGETPALRFEVVAGVPCLLCERREVDDNLLLGHEFLGRDEGRKFMDGVSKSFEFLDLLGDGEVSSCSRPVLVQELPPDVKKGTETPGVGNRVPEGNSSSVLRGKLFELFERNTRGAGCFRCLVLFVGVGEGGVCDLFQQWEQ